MTISEVQALAAALAKTLTAEIQAFEAATGCIVHSLPITEAKPSTVHVKVQIPQ